jgi:hypothetical protein
MRHAIIALSVLISVAHADVKEGWTVGNSDKVYGGAREACDALLKQNRDQEGVVYVIDRMEKTERGDEVCWFKNSKNDGPGVTQVLVSRARRVTYEGVPIYRGSTKAKRGEPTTLEHDLGPGFYFAKQQYVARAYAQAAYVESADKTTDGVVWEYDFEQPDKGVLDFSTGDLKQEFEAAARKELHAELAERMFNGEVNPVHYYRAFKAFVATKLKKQPSDFPIVIAPDYRHADVQIRIADKAIVTKLDKQAMVSLTTKAPSKEDIAAAMVGHETNQLFTACTPTAESKCAVWPQTAGKLLFMRRGWQSVLHYYVGPKGNHWHLRIGNVIIDGTFMQFDDAAKNQADKGELFVGTRADLISRLDNLMKPKGGMSGKKLVETYYDAPPKPSRLVHRATSAKADSIGEVLWDPAP